MRKGILFLVECNARERVTRREKGARDCKHVQSVFGENVAFVHSVSSLSLSLLGSASAQHDWLLSSCVLSSLVLSLTPAVQCSRHSRAPVAPLPETHTHTHSHTQRNTTAASWIKSIHPFREGKPGAAAAAAAPAAEKAIREKRSLSLAHPSLHRLLLSSSRDYTTTKQEQTARGPLHQESRSSLTQTVINTHPRGMAREAVNA